MAVFLPSNAIGQIGAFTAVQPCCLCVATGVSWTTGGNARLWRVPCYVFKESPTSSSRKTDFGSIFIYFLLLLLLLCGINQPQKAHIPRRFAVEE